MKKVQKNTNRTQSAPQLPHKSDRLRFWMGRSPANQLIQSDYRINKDMTIESPATKNKIDDADRKVPLESLQAARKLRQMRREHGIDYVYLAFDDVDGDWLDQWGKDEG